MAITSGEWRMVKGPPIDIPKDQLDFCGPTMYADQGKVAKILPYTNDDARLMLASKDLLAALEGILGDPYGCSLCDSGRPRNTTKGHQPDCPYEIARAAVDKAKGSE